MRAPRTCPAVRMRRATAAQGKASTVLSALFSHPSGKGRGTAGDRWSGAAHGKPGGAATPNETTPSLKGAAPSQEAACGRLREGLTVAVNNYRSTSSERDQGSELNPRRRRIPASRTWRGLAPGSKPFPSGLVLSLSCASRGRSGARQAPQGLGTVIACDAIAETPLGGVK